MKKTNLVIVALILAVSVFTGCKNNKKHEDVNPSNPSKTAHEFFTNNGAKKQSFKVNVDNYSTSIIGEKGTQVTFPKGAFTRPNGLAATGEVQIQLIEIFDKKDMILSDRPTTCNGQLLVSGGEIYIGATADGEELELNDSSSIQVVLPATTTEAGMTLFTGSVDSSQFNWTAVTGVQPVQNIPYIDSSSVNDTTPYFYYDPSKYIFTISNLGWINCDRFYNAPVKTSIDIVCHGVLDENNMRAYLIFKDINSVSSLWAYPTGTFNAYQVPVGEKVTAVVFCLKDGKQYLAVKDVTITANMQIDVDLEESSEDAIVEQIKQKCN